MLKTNKEFLPVQSVQGKVHHPTLKNIYRLGRDGDSRVLAATGGITYNAKIGDNCMKWVSDHLEPGVSLRNENKEENDAIQTFACIGNTAIVVSGKAKGAKGYVTGKHGGIEHCMIYFPEDVLEKMAIDDAVLIKATGAGLRVDGFPDVFCNNLDPELFDKMGVTEKGGVLEVPVAFEIPAVLMGSGIGSRTSHTGDYDITTGDKEAFEKLNLKEMRFGDIVLLQDCDNTYGREYIKGAVSIGVVIHGDSTIMGHGPGITTIMTCKTARIRGKISADANIATYLLKAEKKSRTAPVKAPK
ncbi:MAG: DUF4438 domain-containing protein [Treponema sp.]|nr:DUF4438 domain-containing protein [Treponema sp.]